MRPTSACASADGFENLVERHHHVIEFLRAFAQPELQREEGAGHRARHGDFLAGDFGPGKLLFGHEHRAVTVAHARAAGQQRISLAHISVGVQADGGDVQFAARGAFVQRLDVLQNMLEAETVRRNQTLRQRVEHESVIGIGRVTQRQRRWLHRRKLIQTTRTVTTRRFTAVCRYRGARLCRRPAAAFSTCCGAARTTALQDFQISTLPGLFRHEL